MKILIVASEVHPFAKTGGLADVTGALPKYLHRLGHDVRVVLPCYPGVGRGGPVRKMRKSFQVVLDGTSYKGFLRQSLLGEVPVYLVENRDLFQRDGLYGTPAGDYPDNAARFAFFCRGVLEMLKQVDFRPDVIHCHDWQTALIPLLLRHQFGAEQFFRRTATVFTIHNLAYQGLFSRDSLADMGLDESFFSIDRIEYYGRINLLKGGILSAEQLTTVSPTYCREILTPEQGYGLEGVLADRKADLTGIINGLDPEEWDPATDREIFRTYSSRAPAGKRANKQRLQRLLGMEQSDETPLIGMVSRLAGQKGFDLVAEVLPWLAGQDLQLAVLGTGDEKYLRLFRELGQEGHRNISLTTGFDPSLARKIYAGSDIFLMPSLYEPCGLGQLIALRYGAVPLVRKTGGLADTVFDISRRDEANGFTFDRFTADDLRQAIERALDAWKDRRLWQQLMRRGMRMDSSWERSAERYVEVYLRATARKGG